jgi:hypothetical protein
MRRSALALVIVTALTAFIAASCTRAEPRVSLSMEKVPRQWTLDVRGAGFTPAHNVTSHLRRFDGSEFPVLPILTNGNGEFTHQIDTMILELGIHELWVVDDATGKSSNHVKFEVTFDYPPAS